MQITGHTRLGGLLGSPVAHSISPMMHNDAFQALDIDNVYLCFDIGPDKLPDTVKTLVDMNTYGFNCTMPDKTAVIPCLDELSIEAELIGAVNTVRNEGGHLTGYNTDGIGYMRSASTAGVDVIGKEMILLGSGGAARAIAVQAALDGVRALHLVCRRSASWSRAVELVDKINAHTECRADLTDSADIQAVQQLTERSALLTNATSAGMAPHTDLLPLPEEIVFPDTLVVSDVIYNPRQTRLLQKAAAQGCKTFNGMHMLLYQGAAAFSIWTGQEMPVELIRSKYFQ